MEMDIKQNIKDPNEQVTDMDPYLVNLLTLFI